MPEEKQVVEIVKTHPLKREIRPPYNWCELLARWEASGNDYFWKESLLHNGFNVSLDWHHGEKKYDEIDRLMFYFEVAESWGDYSSFALPDDRWENKYKIGKDSEGRWIEKTGPELRQNLARKAFDMLCLNFFRAVQVFEHRPCSEKFHYNWERLVVSGRLFPVIQHFFRVDKEYPTLKDNNNVVLRNLSFFADRRSNNEQHAVAFILNLAHFLWERERPDPFDYNATKEEIEKYLIDSAERIRLAKPWMIEVLAELRQLDVLEEWILCLDKTCVAKLTEIALLRNRPQFKTLDEACFAGSRAAWLLKKHELMTREDKRLQEIRETELAVAEAQRKLQELQGKKK
jgi:hypothetical protein